MSKTPNLKINVSAPKDQIQIKPIALINIYLHAYRFWKIKDPKPQYSYGFCLGKFEGSTRVITEVIPLIHSPKSDLVFEEDFYKHWDDLNAMKEDIEAPERCIGWYKVIEGDMKFRAQDIRNQVKIQTLDKRNISFLLDPRKYFDTGDYGFSVFHLKGDRIFHEMCDYEKIPWEIAEVGGDVDKVVQFISEMIRKYNSDKPFVEELEETKVPIPEKSPDDKDEGDYVTPAVDPNQPFFF